MRSACLIPFRFTASRSTRRGSIWSRNIRRCRTPSNSGCPISASRCRRPRWRGGSPSNPWLAELQQDMFIEISPADAADRGIKDGGWVWVTGAESNSKAKMKALVTERVGKGVAWMPFHFGGWFAGRDLRGNYPKGSDPIVLGESANTITTYGYDPATGMQEPKVTLCQIAAA